MALSTDAKTRKGLPVATGFVDYFPDAMVAVAELSKVGNDQHNPGKPLHWDRSKSGDESDALMRHFLERGTLDSDGIRHSAKVAWRAMALLQKEIEAEAEKVEAAFNNCLTDGCNVYVNAPRVRCSKCIADRNLDYITASP